MLTPKNKRKMKNMEKTTKKIKTRLLTDIKLSPIFSGNINSRKPNKMLGMLVIFLLLATFVIIPQTVADTPWWDSSYSYRRSIAITHNFLKYQTQIVVVKDNQSGGTISCNNHCQDDFSDIRFIHDSTDVLPYWRQNYTSGVRATFWVNNSYNDSTIYVYYGNPIASYAGNGTICFDFFDDFLGTTLNATKWATTGSPTITFSSGVMTFSTTTATTYISSSAYRNFGKGTQIFTLCKFLGDGTRSEGIGYRVEPGTPYYTPQTLCIYPSEGTASQFYWCDGVAYTSGSSYTHTTKNQIVNLRRGVSRVWGTSNDTAAVNVNSSTYVPTDTCDIRIGKVYGADSSKVYVDWIFVAKFRDYSTHSTPAWSTIGSQEKYGIATPPLNSNPSPSNGATKINITTSLTITVTSPGGNKMNATFKTNASGTWQAIAVRHNVNNGTYANTTTVFTKYSHKYWWNVSTNDGMGGWDNDTYTFTTTTINTKVKNISPYSQDGSPLTILSNGSSDLSNVTLYYRYSPDNISYSPGKGYVWRDTAVGLTSMSYPNTGVVAYATYYNHNSWFGYFAVLNSNCIAIYNLTDVSNPVFVNDKTDGTYLSSPHDIVIVDYTPNERIAYVCNYGANKYVSAFNVTNPASITRINSVATGAACMYMSVDYVNMLMYVTTNDEVLHSYDISNPSTFSELDTISSGLDAPWYPTVNTNDPDYVYVVNLGATGGIRIYDVSDPSDMAYVGALNTSITGYRVIIDGDYMYSLQDAPSNKLVAYDITNPASPVFVSLTNPAVYGHLWSDTKHRLYLRLYNATADNGVMIVDATDPSNPTLITELTHNASNKMQRIHWAQIFYNNISGKYQVEFVNYLESALIGYDVFYDEGYDWHTYSTDNSYPWSFNFNFPNSTGYYEFYSIGKKTGSTVETAPLTKDAMCYYDSLGNAAPVLSNPSPANNSINQSLTFIWNVTIHDPEGDLFDWSIECNGWNVSNDNYDSADGETNGSKEVHLGYQPGFELDYSTTYTIWVNVTDGTAWTRETYYFDTLAYVFNMPPTFGSPSPANNSIEVTRYHATNVTVYDLDGNSTTVCFWSSISNSPYSWSKVQQNNTVSANTTVRDVNSSYSGGWNTQYWWMVTASDGHSNSSVIYKFTTTFRWLNRAPGLGSPSPANTSTGVVLYHATNVTVYDLDGNLTTVCFWNNNTGAWLKYQQNNSVVANTTVYCTNNTWAEDYSTEYWWMVTANDTMANSTAIYHFTTEDEGIIIPPVTDDYTIYLAGIAVLFLLVALLFFVIRRKR